MCFSATASFATSGLLLAVGGASIAIVSKPSQRLLASTPIIFAIQQFCEGVLWLSIYDSTLFIWQQFATYLFVIFGQVVWPIWVPLADLLLEKKDGRRNFLIGSLGFGILMSLVLLYQIAINDVSATVMKQHIQYHFDYPDFLMERLSLLYLIPTVGSHFISSIKKINFLGVFTLITFLASKVFFYQVVFSTWCFFAAILSFWIYFIIRSEKTS
jgi:hypothetical protein